MSRLRPLAHAVDGRDPEDVSGGGPEVGQDGEPVRRRDVGQDGDPVVVVLWDGPLLGHVAVLQDVLDDENDLL